MLEFVLLLLGQLDFSFIVLIPLFAGFTWAGFGVPENENWLMLGIVGFIGLTLFASIWLMVGVASVAWDFEKLAVSRSHTRQTDCNQISDYRMLHRVDGNVLFVRKEEWWAKQYLDEKIVFARQAAWCLGGWSESVSIVDARTGKRLAGYRRYFGGYDNEEDGSWW